MKYFKRIIFIATSVFSLLCLTNSSEVKATDITDLKEMWYETNDYPITVESAEWNTYGLEEVMNILNPPEDLLHSFSTEKLAELMLDYPYLWVLTSYEYNEMDYFFGFIEDGCLIYNELMSREDGVLCLLKEYQMTEFDANLYNENPYMVWGYNPMANAEVFGCQFIMYNSSKFNEDEYELCCQVMLEKAASYSMLNDNIAKLYLSFVKEQPNNYDVVEPIISNIPENQIMSTSNGFVATGEPYSRSIENVNIYFTPGTYYKYDVSTSCLQWYSGVYDEETQQACDNRIAFSWYRLSKSSPKYNCHAYAWLSANVSNPYWLDSPATYMASSSVTYVGSNVTPQIGDIVVMYNRNTGAIAHSAVVSQTPSGSTGIYTLSKIGGCGLYRAPLSELKTYYRCDNYDVYRTN